MKRFLLLPLTLSVLLRRGAHASSSPSPLFNHVLSSDAQRVQERLKAGGARSVVLKKLQEISPLSSSERVEHQVDTFYLPLYAYYRDLLDRHRGRYAGSSSTPAPPFLVAVSAPQGCGKTTLTTLLELLFDLDEISCLGCSLDDFYLTGDSQERLASRHAGNTLLQYRGNAGTHDLGLLFSTFAQLSQTNAPRPSALAIPRYDKSLRAGRGDRADPSQWRILGAKSVEIVLFEGWMLGFEPLSAAEISSEKFRKEKDTTSEHAPDLVQVNAYLRDYAKLHALFDAWLIVAVDDIDHVFKWRLQAETSMGQQGKARLSDKQVQDFVSRFMPAYASYLPRLYQQGPPRRSPDVPVLKLSVNQDRSVTRADVM